MINARIVKKGDDFIGEIFNLPSGIEYNGGIQGAKSHTFQDLLLFKETIHTLLEKGIALESCPPYLDLITKEDTDLLPPEQFDWDKVPEETMGEIMQHQVEAVEAAINTQGGRSLIALPPGFGKTMIGCLCGMHYGPNILILAQASKIKDWQDEYSKWTGRPRPVEVKKTNSENVAPVSICSYDKAKKCRPLIERKWNLIIVDEAHLFKNTCQRTDKLIPTLIRADALLLLTGTPTENKPSDIFNLLHVINHRIFKDKQTFIDRYSVGYTNRWGVFRDTKAVNLDELAFFLSKVSFIKHDIQSTEFTLERKILTLKPLPEDAEELRKMQKIKDHLVAKAQDMSQSAVREVQIYTNSMWRHAGMCKIAIIEDHVKQWIHEDFPDEKIVFFVQHVKPVEDLKFIIETHSGEECFVINKSTAPAKRIKYIESFRQKDTGYKYGIVTMETAGKGLNFCPGVSVAITIELHRAPSMMIQAEGRIHRKGAIKNLTSIWCILENSWDESIMKKLQTKQVNNNKILQDVKRGKFTFKE